MQMKIKEFYKTDFVSVFYDADTDALWVKYFRNVPSDQHFVCVVDAMLNAFVSLNTQNFIADIRKMGVIGVDAQTLVVNKLLVGMVKHLNGEKLYHIQLIDSAEIMSKVAANNVKRKSMHDGIEIVQFVDEGEAIQYIFSNRLLNSVDSRIPPCSI